MAINRDEWFDDDGNMDFEEVQEDLSFASDMIGMAQRHEANKQRAETNKLLREQAVERKIIATLHDCPNCGGKLPKRGVNVCTHCGGKLFWINLDMKAERQSRLKVFLKSDKYRFTDAINALAIQQQLHRNANDLSKAFQSLYRDAVLQDSHFAKTRAAFQKHQGLVVLRGELEGEAQLTKMKIHSTKIYIKSEKDLLPLKQTLFSFLILPFSAGVSYIVTFWILGLYEYHGLLGVGEILMHESGFQKNELMNTCILTLISIFFIISMVLFGRIDTTKKPKKTLASSKKTLASLQKKLANINNNPSIIISLKIQRHLQSIRKCERYLADTGVFLAKIRPYLKYADLDRINDQHLFDANYKLPTCSVNLIPDTRSLSKLVLKAAESMNVTID